MKIAFEIDDLLDSKDISIIEGALVLTIVKDVVIQRIRDRMKK